MTIITTIGTTTNAMSPKWSRPMSRRSLSITASVFKPYSSRRGCCICSASARAQRLRRALVSFASLFARQVEKQIFKANRRNPETHGFVAVHDSLQRPQKIRSASYKQAHESVVAFDMADSPERANRGKIDAGR